MRPAWRLAINSLSERRSRTALLVATVALSAGLIVAVACAMASLNRALEMRIASTVGAADLRVRHVGGRSFERGLVETIAGWPEVQLAVGRAQGSLTLRRVGAEEGSEQVVVTFGVTPAVEYQIRPQKAVSGRLLEVGAVSRAAGAPAPITLDVAAAEALQAAVGDRLDVVRFGEPMTLEVVGIVERPALGMMARPESFLSLEDFGEAAQLRGRVREVDIVLREGQDPSAVAEARREEMPRGLLLQVTEKVTSGLFQNLKGGRIGLTVASTLSFLSAAFIIMTGLSVNVTERLRELAVLRSLGATRGQLAEAQLAVGLIIGGLGALAGVPLGIGMAATLVGLFPEQLPGGFQMAWVGTAMGALGAVLAGLIGALLPAVRASRITPLEGLSIRARATRPRAVVAALAAGVVGVVTQMLVLTVPEDGRTVFWADMTLGLPAMFTGYFLLATPATVVVVTLLGTLVARGLGVPASLLKRTVIATPFRHGFTAGAMMVGLALLVAIWTNGRSIMHDWVGALDFPDGFVSGLNLSEATQRRIESLDAVETTTAITMQRLETDAFGVRGLTKYRTTYIAFEPTKFFEMTKINWLEPATEAEQRRAIERLEEGGAILVAREFRTARGLGAGDSLTLEFEGRSYDFEIVGVVTSPGLEIASKYFDIGEEYLEQALNAVFGSRKDLVEKFGNDAINLIQIDLKDGVDDAAVMESVRKIAGAGIIDAGSGREMKARISEFIGGSLFIFSVVALASMLVACLGVANLIIAGIQARQFEFGVLRAVGGARGQVVRLVLAEAVIIAITACALGTIMGTQASWAGQRLYEVLLGIDLSLNVPPVPVVTGWGILSAITLLAAWPAVWRLSRRKPRELLGSMKG